MPAENFQSPSRRDVAERLHQEAVGVKLERSQFGVSRKVSSEQKQQIANLFGADSGRLSAGKKVLNKQNEAYKRVTNLLGQARDLWLNSTLPYPEEGVRLIRRNAVEQFSAGMEVIRTELQAAAQELQEVYHSVLIPEARERLGLLFNASDYPLEIADEFDVVVSYPNIEPDERLRQISATLYEGERQRMQARFEESIALAEQAFAGELAKVAENLIERLTPGPDGKQKVFRDSAIENVNELLSRFKALDIGSNQGLTDLMEQAERAVQGIDLKNLRKDVNAQRSVKEVMERLSGQLGNLLVDRPKRKITLQDEPGESGEVVAEQAAPVEQNQGEEVAA